MDKYEVIAQLQSIIENAKDMLRHGGDEIWQKDIDALEYAIKVLQGG